MNRRGHVQVAIGTRIGSPSSNVAGGEISVTAGGTIALNSAGPGNAGSIHTADGVHLFPNRSSGGYFVNGREGVTYQGFDALFTGPLPARLGRSLMVSYGE